MTPPDQPGSRDNGGGLRQPARLLERDSLPSARRVVVKIGSSSLTDQRGRLDDRRIDEITAVAAGLIESGSDVVIVSSGAIAAALGPLGLPHRPTAVDQQQATASVGQALLATSWSRAFGRHGRVTGQVLLTESDVIGRQTYRNVRSALEALLSMAPCRWSTRTTPPPPMRSASATTTAWPPWWPSCWGRTR